jgi:ZIP family zinc transporter
MAYTVSTLAGICTLLGAVMVLALGVPRPPSLAAVLGLAAGIMVGVTLGDLLPAAMNFGRLELVLTGLLCGILALALLDKGLKVLIDPSRPGFFKTGVLVALGIALHDLPEGMAIAAGFASTAGLGLVMALAIGLHNIPEGMATAAPLRAAGVAPLKILFLATVLSLITPLGTLAGFGLIETTDLSLCILSALAAGAMLYISLVELIPRSLTLCTRPAAAGMAAGMVLVWCAQLFF